MLCHAPVWARYCVLIRAYLRVSSSTTPELFTRVFLRARPFFRVLSSTLINRVFFRTLDPYACPLHVQPSLYMASSSSLTPTHLTIPTTTIIDISGASSPAKIFLAAASAAGALGIPSDTVGSFAALPGPFLSDTLPLPASSDTPPSPFAEPAIKPKTAVYTTPFGPTSTPSKPSLFPSQPPRQRNPLPPPMLPNLTLPPPPKPSPTPSPLRPTPPHH
jgi:hypothetical protein